MSASQVRKSNGFRLGRVFFALFYRRQRSISKSVSTISNPAAIMDFRLSFMFQTRILVFAIKQIRLRNREFLALICV